MGLEKETADGLLPSQKQSSKSEIVARLIWTALYTNYFPFRAHRDRIRLVYWYTHGWETQGSRRKKKNGIRFNNSRIKKEKRYFPMSLLFSLETCFEDGSRLRPLLNSKKKKKKKHTHKRNESSVTHRAAAPGEKKKTNKIKTKVRERQRAVHCDRSIAQRPKKVGNRWRCDCRHAVDCVLLLPLGSIYSSLSYRHSHRRDDIPSAPLLIGII